MKFVPVLRLALYLCNFAFIATAHAQQTPAPTASISDVHRVALTPASDVLFKAEATPPKSEQSWVLLERNAATLARSAAALTSQDIAKDKKQWMLFSRALRTEAQSAAVAAKQRDLNELIAANGRIVAICESCHDQYRDGGHGMTSDRPREQ